VIFALWWLKIPNANAEHLLNRLWTTMVVPNSTSMVLGVVQFCYWSILSGQFWPRVQHVWYWVHFVPLTLGFAGTERISLASSTFPVYGSQVCWCRTHFSSTRRISSLLLLSLLRPSTGFGVGLDLFYVKLLLNPSSLGLQSLFS